MPKTTQQEAKPWPNRSSARGPAAAVLSAAAMLVALLAWPATLDAGSPSEPVARFGHVMAVGPAGEVYLFGGDDGQPGALAAKSLLGGLHSLVDTEWQELSPTNPPPPTAGASGGVTADGKLHVGYGDNGFGISADQHTYDPVTNAFTESTAFPPAPPARVDASIAVLGNDLFLFGGMGATGLRADLWRIDPAARTATQQPSLPGAPRKGHCTVVSESTDSLLALFGENDGGAQMAEVWQFLIDTAVWQQLTFPGGAPPGRADAACTKNGDSFWVAGGTGAGGQELDDVWRLDLQSLTWTQEGNLDGPRTDAGAAPVDADHIVVFGGLQGGLPIALTELFPPEPPPRDGHELIDCGDGTSILFGGDDGQPSALAGKSLFNDLWEFSSQGKVWDEVTPSGAPPGPNARHAGAASSNGKKYYFGGEGFSPDLISFDPQSLMFADENPVAMVPGREDATLTADGSDLYLFGGEGSGGLHSDLWKLDTTTSPPTATQLADFPGEARKGHCTIFDSVTGSLLTFFGLDNLGAPIGDRWHYDIAGDQWSEVTGGLAPPSRAHVGCSKNGNLVFVAGGMDAGGEELSEVWVLDLATGSWNLGGMLDTARADPAVGNDGPGRIVVHGGRSGGNPIAETELIAPLFIDDFETGDTGRWSDAIGEVLAVPGSAGIGSGADKDRSPGEADPREKK